MNPARIALDNRTTTLVLTFAMIVGGLLAYQNLGRLEDPEFTTGSRMHSSSLPIPALRHRRSKRK